VSLLVDLYEKEYNPVPVEDVKKRIQELLKSVLPKISQKMDVILKGGDRVSVVQKDEGTVSYYVSVNPKKVGSLTPKGIEVVAQNISRGGDWNRVVLHTDFDGKLPDWKVVTV
jgi:hypothetical protein